MDLNLWFNPSLLDKTKQKAAEAREADRPFVPETLASSTISPSGISASTFSSPTYTNTTSLSRPLVDQQGAGGDFSRGEYSTPENQATQNAGTGSSGVTVTRVTTSGGSTSDLMGLSPEQPNRLISPTTAETSWFVAYDDAIFSSAPDTYGSTDVMTNVVYKGDQEPDGLIEVPSGTGGARASFNTFISTSGETPLGEKMCSIKGAATSASAGSATFSVFTAPQYADDDIKNAGIEIINQSSPGCAFAFDAYFSPIYTSFNTGGEATLRFTVYVGLLGSEGTKAGSFSFSSNVVRYNEISGGGGVANTGISANISGVLETESVTSSIIKFGSWNRYFFTFDGKKARWFIDGSEVMSLPFAADYTEFFETDSYMLFELLASVRDYASPTISIGPVRITAFDWYADSDNEVPSGTILS